MKVSELIARLATMDPNAEVFLASVEYGMLDLKAITGAAMREDLEDEYQGADVLLTADE